MLNCNVLNQHFCFNCFNSEKWRFNCWVKFLRNCELIYLNIWWFMKIGLRKWFFFGVKQFFFMNLDLKMGVKMNFRIITKNHAADSKTGFPEKPILEPIGLPSPTRQLGSYDFFSFLLVHNNSFSED